MHSVHARSPQSVFCPASLDLFSWAGRLRFATGGGEFLIEHRVGVARRLSSGFVVGLASRKIIINRVPVGKVEGYRAVNLFEREKRKRLSDCFGGLPAQEGVHDRIERDARPYDAIAVLKLLHVSVAHARTLIPARTFVQNYSRAAQKRKGALAGACLCCARLLR